MSLIHRSPAGAATEMRAIATRRESFTHDLKVRDHRLVADEPEDRGGSDAGPSPQELLAASLASCTAITMEMYAKRKGWDVGRIEVAAAGENMPPKSTYFFPKILTGLVFNPLG